MLRPALPSVRNADDECRATCIHEARQKVAIALRGVGLCSDPTAHASGHGARAKTRARADAGARSASSTGAGWPGPRMKLGHRARHRTPAPCSFARVVRGRPWRLLGQTRSGTRYEGVQWGCVCGLRAKAHPAPPVHGTALAWRADAAANDRARGGGCLLGRLLTTLPAWVLFLCAASSDPEGAREAARPAVSRTARGARRVEAAVHRGVAPDQRRQRRVRVRQVVDRGRLLFFARHA